MSKLKRPARGETEEDLLEFQEQFLASQKEATSASIVKENKYGLKRKTDENTSYISNDKRNEDKNDLPTKVPTYEKTKPKSRFKKGREPLYEVPGPGSKDILLDSGGKVSAFLTQIVERDTKKVTITEPKPSNVAFPAVKQRVTNTVKKTTGGEKLSLFAQQFIGENDESMCVEDIPSKTTSGILESSIIQGSGLSVSFAQEEVKKIHEENMAKLNEMTQEEILEEQKKLTQSIDPKLLAFLKKKKLTKDKIGSKLMDTSENKSKLGSPCTKSEKQVSFADTELPVKVEEGWVGMDNVEYDKLEWMKEVAELKTEQGTGKQARFDLNGEFLVADAKIPVHKGLHHHGDEPERAGYTLEELFHLARSTNIPQRKLALLTLAKIFVKCRQGEYVNHIQTHILPTVLQAGVIFLLRWALDDSNESIQMATISTLYGLICSKADEESLDLNYYWYQGLVQPCLSCPESEDEATNADDEEKPQESDDEMSRRDLIKALVKRMMFLPRLKYLLMEKSLSAPSIVQVLCLLTRVSQHSQSMAYEIVHCPGLLKYIFAEFLPTSWENIESEKQMFTARKYPLPEAMKLIGVICKAGKNMTAIMMSSYGLQDILQRYIAVPSGDLQLPSSVAVNLQKQSFIVWKICLSYGYGGELYLNLYSVFLQNLQSCHYSILNDKQCEYGGMISALESVLHVAAVPQQQEAFNNQEELMESEDQAENILDWSNVASIIDIIIQSVTHLLKYIGNNYQFQRLNLEMVTCLTAFVASFYDKIDSQLGYNAVDTLHTIEMFQENVLSPFWKSLGLRHMLVNLSQYSNILCPIQQHQDMSSCLPSYGACCLVNGTTLPLLQKTSPFPFLTSYLRLITSLCRLHKGMIDKILPSVVDDEEIVSYFRKIIQHNNNSLYANYFTKFENIFQFQFLKLCALKESKDMSLMHHASLQLLLRLQHGDEYLIHDLFSYVVFSPQFLSETRGSEESLQSMADLQLSEVKKLKSATQEEITLVKSQLLESARNDLLSGSIKTVYLDVFSGGEAQAVKSRARYHQNTTKIDTLLTGKVEENILPQDWMFLPLVELYNTSALRGSHYQDHMPVQNVRMVGSVLEWIYLLECERPEILKPVSVTIKLSRIMCTFLAGNDLFLEKCVRGYLAALLREYTKPLLLSQMDFNKSIPGLTSFFDLYQSLLEQYAAVSFGDSVFGSYVLIPLQQCHDVELRLCLWGEHHEALRALLISVSELLLPIERYLEPDETNTSLLQHYFTHLASQLITPVRTPVPYIIAIHHLNHFLYYTQHNHNNRFWKEVWSWVKLLRLEPLKKHLLYYKKVNVEEEHSMELYTQLPQNRQQTLDFYLNI